MAGKYADARLRTSLSKFFSELKFMQIAPCLIHAVGILKLAEGTPPITTSEARTQLSESL